MGTNLQSSILLNCVITNNVATSGGSGIYISTSGAMSIDPCTIANNDVKLETTAAATTSSFTSCIIWPATISKTNGTPAFNYCDIQGGWLSGVGNIDENPKFADVQLLDYRLASNSPCVGTGENGTNMGALGSCGIEYQVFKYPLTIGTTWTYKYDYDYSHLAWWEKRHGFHYWSVIDSIINNSDIISFKIQSINKDTVSSSSTPDPPTLIIDTTYFYIDRGFDIIIVRPPSSIPYMSIEDSIQGFFRSDQSFHLPPSPPYPPDYGRFYQEGLGLVRMRANQYTNTHYDELQQLTEFNGNPVFPKNK